MNKQNTMRMDRRTLPRMWLHARGHEVKTGCSFLQSMLFGAWAMVAFSILSSIVFLAHNWVWACIALTGTIVFGLCVMTFDKRMKSLKTRSFDLNMTSESITLGTFVHATQTQKKTTLKWPEIRRAEFSGYGDQQIVVLRGANSSIKLPLSPFGLKKHVIVQNIALKQIPIWRVPQQKRCETDI